MPPPSPASTTTAPGAHPAPPLLLVDLGSPFAYLTTERIARVLPHAQWQTIALGAIFKATGRASWGDSPQRRAAGQAEVERRAAALGLPPVRWPEPWPNNGLLAARVAVWAASQRRERAFITAALRTQFVDGAALSDPVAVERALRRAELDPAAGLAAAHHASIKQQLRERTDAAMARGVFGVPSVAVGPFVVWGDDQLELAAQLAAAGARQLGDSGPAAGAEQLGDSGPAAGAQQPHDRGPSAGAQQPHDRGPAADDAAPTAGGGAREGRP